MTDTLYDEDFTLWTEAQAAALRAEAARKRGSNAVDWENVATEIEDMGKRDLKAAMSLCARVLEHLFLLSAVTRAEPRGHWRKEVRTLRRDLRLELTPTIRKRVGEALDALHIDAVAAVTDELASVEPSALPIDAARRWTLAEIAGEKNDPLDAMS